MKVIKFYTTKDEYGFMSNFYRSAITIGGKEYMTTEHFYQAMKFPEDSYVSTGDCIQTQVREHIRTQHNPKLAANEGRRKDLPMRKDWDLVKDNAMWTALVAKFTQHPDLAKKLLDTGDAHLVEDTTTTNDCYWGCGTVGRGLNMLGLQLMAIRGKLRNGFPLE